MCQELMHACIRIQGSASLLCRDSIFALYHPRTGLKMAIMVSLNIQCTVMSS